MSHGLFLNHLFPLVQPFSPLLSLPHSYPNAGFQYNLNAGFPQIYISAPNSASVFDPYIQSATQYIHLHVL